MNLSSLHLDSRLIERATQCAQSEGRDLSSVLESLLRNYVNDADATDVGNVWARMDRSLRRSDVELGGYDEITAAESS